MPTICATYPLSELWTNKYPAKQTQKPVRQQQSQQPQQQKGLSDKKEERREFYALDVQMCEGVNNKVAPKQTVRQFSINQKLPRRVTEWEWFMALSIEVGKRHLDTKLIDVDPSRKCVDAYLSILNGIWYDFDSVPVTSAELKRLGVQPHPNATKEGGGKETKEDKWWRGMSLEEEWKVIKATIEARTRMVCDSLEKECDFTSEGKKFIASFERYLKGLEQKGITFHT